MKATKFIVLVGGILGILAFFLPLVSVHRANFDGKASAFQVIKGLDTVSNAVDAADARSALEVDNKATASKDVGALKGIIMAFFAPALLLSVIGAFGVKRKRFGRGAGTLSLLLGLIGLGIGAVLKSAAEGDAGIALTLLMVTGAAGVIGGLLALIKPERLAITTGMHAAA